MSRPADILRLDFATLPELIRAHAHVQPEPAALIHDGRRIPYSALDQMADCVAASLQRRGFRPRDSVAICAATTIEYLAIFLGSLRAGGAVAPLPTSLAARALAAMIADVGARMLFLDRAVAETCAVWSGAATAPIVVIDGSGDTGDAATDSGQDHGQPAAQRRRQGTQTRTA
jgi:long-chain acyl-CoA synthetase